MFFEDYLEKSDWPGLVGALLEGLNVLSYMFEVEHQMQVSQQFAHIYRQFTDWKKNANDQSYNDFVVENLKWLGKWLEPNEREKRLMPYHGVCRTPIPDNQPQENLNRMAN